MFRIIIGGNIGLSGYITKFPLNLISQHPDFTSSSITMNVLPSGSYDVVTETGMPSLVSLTPTISIVSFINVTYSFVQNYDTNVDYITDNQSLSVVEKTKTQVLPDLSCSLSSSTSIVFSLGSDNNMDVPSWISIDTNTGLLTIASPEVNKDTSYSFNVNAVITGVSQQIKKSIKLIVKDCSTCGSKEAMELTISIQSIICVIIIVSVITCMLNVASISSLWSLINQVQLFFLLLITRAYIPDDVKLVITGLKIMLNPFLYFSWSRITAYNSTINTFNFELSNNLLSNVGVDSDSSVSNTISFFIITIIMIIIHFLVIILYKLLAKCQIDLTGGCFSKTVKWITDKLYNLLTFNYYIRSSLEMNQYLLICSVYEIYNFNVSDSYRIASLVFAMLLLSGCILIAMFAFCLSISSYTINEEKHNVLGEFISGLKLDKKFKLYGFILILRRTVFVILLLTCVLVDFRLIIGVLAFLQLIYLTYVCYLRPFKEFKDNLSEILNELYFQLLLSSLIYLNTESNWSPTLVTTYMWVIMSNFIVTFTITAINCIIASIMKCISKQSNTRASTTRQVTPVQFQKRTQNLQTNKSKYRNREIRVNDLSSNIREEGKYQDDRGSNVFVF